MEPASCAKLPAYDPEYLNEEQVASSSHEAYHPVAIQIASSANTFNATTGYQVRSCQTTQMLGRGRGQKAARDLSQCTLPCGWNTWLDEMA